MPQAIHKQLQMLFRKNNCYCNGETKLLSKLDEEVAKDEKEGGVLSQQIRNIQTTKDVPVL